MFLFLLTSFVFDDVLTGKKKKEKQYLISSEILQTHYKCTTKMDLAQIDHRIQRRDPTCKNKLEMKRKKKSVGKKLENSCDETTIYR